MMLTNLMDYMQDDSDKFHIPEYWDDGIRFPYCQNEDGMIIDSQGCPAVFTGDMINSLDWDVWTEPRKEPDGTEAMDQQESAG